MNIERLSEDDFRIKIEGSVFIMNYNRHPSGKRLGVALSRCTNNTAKIRANLWDYKQGRFSPNPVSVSLDVLEFPKPNVGYIDTVQGITYIRPGSTTMNRYKFGLTYSRIKQLQTHELLSLYGIYKRRFPNIGNYTKGSMILSPSLLIHNRTLIYNNKFAIGKFIDGSLQFIDKESEDLYREAIRGE